MSYLPAILAQLRPPFARSALFLFPYASEGFANNGITVELPLAEPAIAPGGGAVKRVWTAFPQWRVSNTDLAKRPVIHVTIDHGSGVETTIA